MKHGIVTSTKVTDDGHIVATVQSSRAGVTWENKAVLQQHPGSVQNIEEGWHVALDQCDDGLWIILGVLNTEPDLLPNDLSGKEQSMKFDNGTEISARQNDNEDYEVTISASGSVSISGGNGESSLTIL